MAQTSGASRRWHRRTCEWCRERKARFQYAGRVRADRDHTLCFGCFRRERERQRARSLVGQGCLSFDPAGLAPVASAGAVTARQMAHRRRMLDNLTRQAKQR